MGDWREEWAEREEQSRDAAGDEKLPDRGQALALLRGLWWLAVLKTVSELAFGAFINGTASWEGA